MKSLTNPPTGIAFLPLLRGVPSPIVTPTTNSSPHQESMCGIPPPSISFFFAVSPPQCIFVPLPHSALSWILSDVKNLATSSLFSRFICGVPPFYLCVNCHNPNNNTTQPQHNLNTIVGFDTKMNMHSTPHHHHHPNSTAANIYWQELNIMWAKTTNRATTTTFMTTTTATKTTTKSTSHSSAPSFF